MPVNRLHPPRASCEQPEGKRPVSVDSKENSLEKVFCSQKICIKLQDFIDTSMICSSYDDNYEKEPKRNYDVLVSQGFENISYVLLFNISTHISRKTANSEPGFETRIHSFASKMTVQNRLQSHHTLHTRQKLLAATIVNCVFEKQTLCIIF